MLIDAKIIPFWCILASAISIFKDTKVPPPTTHPLFLVSSAGAWIHFQVWTFNLSPFLEALVALFSPLFGFPWSFCCVLWYLVLISSTITSMFWLVQWLNILQLLLVFSTRCSLLQNELHYSNVHCSACFMSFFLKCSSCVTNLGEASQHFY